MNKIIIENKDIFKFIHDKLKVSIRALSSIESNKYLDGQIATLRSLELIFSQLLEEGWSKENVINNFYRLTLGSKEFEKKYKEIWK